MSFIRRNFFFPLISLRLVFFALNFFFCFFSSRSLYSATIFSVNLFSCVGSVRLITNFPSKIVIKRNYSFFCSAFLVWNAKPQITLKITIGFSLVFIFDIFCFFFGYLLLFNLYRLCVWLCAYMCLLLFYNFLRISASVPHNAPHTHTHTYF